MLFKKFRRNERGGVLPMFALAIVPIFGFVGAAIDYSRAGNSRTELQAALDATALWISKNAATQTAAQIQTAAVAYFNAQFSNPETKVLTVTATYSSSGGSSLTISATGSLSTRFMGIIGVNSMNIGSSSTVKWGNTKLRVALALDNTGSMSSAGKMAALKTATKQLLTTLQNASTTPGDVQVAIVPFAKDVNIGKSNYSANWLDWTDWNEENGDDVSSTTCTNSKGKKKKCTTSSTWVPNNHNTWNGCITDRTQNYDTTNTTPITGTPATLFAPEQYDSCPVAVMGQSYNWTAMNTLVDSMTPDGNTNQGIGLAVAWQTLTDGAPFSPPAITDTVNTQKVIILLTDGLNTENRWYTNQSQIDARQKITCANAKAAGVILYTIQVNTDADATSTMLQNCATDPTKFFLLTTANQIVTAFNQIGTNLAKLRISK
jgi:Flp pilus assembly protein TadG